MESIEQQLAARDLEIDAPTLARLQQLREHGSLTLGWPTKPCLPDSLVWMASDFDQTVRTTSMVSSRLGREVDRLDPIFRVMRTAISQLDLQRQCILTVEGTTTHNYIKRACELFSVFYLNVAIPTPAMSLDRWAKSCLNRLEQTNAAVSDRELSKVCFVSNPLSETKHDVPLRDQVEVLASDQLLVLHARENGNLCTLLRSRLNSANRSRVFVAIGDEKLVPKGIANGLMDEGAVGWFPRAHDGTDSSCKAVPSKQTAKILDRLENQDRYFIHCTRRAKGAWPDQDEHEYLDELILGAPSRDRSCFAAISRILLMQKLIATSESTRGDTPVVSFTSARLDELSRMRTFRQHRGRWDFEPYGIAIDRTCLISLGAREVIYGDDATWDTMSAEERPLFQRIGDTPGAINWSVEKEWRVINDVDLSRVPENNAVAFVPTRAEAEQLAAISRWPIVVANAQDDR